MAVMSVLTITNGDSAAELLAEAGHKGTIVAWQDVLHEGPVPRGYGLTDLSRIRVDYLARRLGIEAADVAAGFAARDAAVLRHRDFARVEIWLEHDLYDQLQLLQILAFFAGERRDGGVVLVQADDFLGAQTAATILRFAAKARPMTANLLAVARAVWDEFGDATPLAISARVERGAIDGLPFMRPALIRMMEELPDSETGLGRTEATALAMLAERPTSGHDLFRGVIAREEAAFMGDVSFSELLLDLAHGGEPTIAGIPELDPNQPEPESLYDWFALPLSLTEFGQSVVRGEADQVATNGIDRWWGGTHLAGHDCWRYDREMGAVIAPRTDDVRRSGDSM
jgi:hypothetical protein